MILVKDSCSCAADCGAPPADEASSCADSLDNDCDGNADCDDSDCISEPISQCVPTHSNGSACSFTNLDATPLDGDTAPCNMLAFDEFDNLFTGRRLVDPDFDCFSGGSLSPNNDSTLESVDINAGMLTELGTNNISNLSAIEFDRFGLITSDFDLAMDVIVKGRTRASSSKKGYTIKITNTGVTSITASTGSFCTTVNSSSFDTSCTGSTKVLSPGSMTRFRCTFNPLARGINPGNNVMYSASLNAVDGLASNNSDSETQVAQ